MRWQNGAPLATAMTHAGALIALHAAVALFAMAGLFGKWLALSALAIVLGRTLVAALSLALASAWRRESPGRAGDKCPPVPSARRPASTSTGWSAPSGT